jgi:hypothetical protein
MPARMHAKTMKLIPKGLMMHPIFAALVSQLAVSSVEAVRSWVKQNWYYFREISGKK